MIALRQSSRCRLTQSLLFRRKDISTTTRTTAESTEPATTTTDLTILEGPDTYSLGTIHRHGAGDATITLNVGGKEFHTLRSTVNANAVLSTLVVRAEQNKELTKGGAVFVDRDPAHFEIV